MIKEQYKIELCKDILQYCFHETELRASEAKEILSKIFDEETINKAINILTGKS